MRRFFKKFKNKKPKKKIIQIRNKIRNLVSLSNIIVPKMSRIEISHHYGVEKFYKFGLCMITIVNDKYCKKYLFMLKGQKHPAQFHKIKQETFFILYGKIELQIKHSSKSSKKILSAGESFTIYKGMVHEFKALSNYGVVIEEISSKHIKTDSYYLILKLEKIKIEKV